MRAVWPHWSEISSAKSADAEFAAWHKAIKAACLQVASGSSWNPMVYGNPINWNSDIEAPAIESKTQLATHREFWDDNLRADLEQDVFLCLMSGALIGESFATLKAKINSDTNSSQTRQTKMRSYLVTSVKTVLLRRKRTTDLERMQDRFRIALKESLEVVGSIPQGRFTLGNAEGYGIADLTKVEELTLEDVWAAVAVVRSYPVERVSQNQEDRQRAPRYFTGATIQEIVIDIAQSIKKALSIVFMDGVIEHVFAYLQDPIPMGLEDPNFELAFQGLSLRNQSEELDLNPGWDGIREEVRDFMLSFTDRELAVLAAKQGAWGKVTSQQIAGALKSSDANSERAQITRQRVEQIVADVTGRIRLFLYESYSDLLGDEQDQLQEVVSVEMNRICRNTDFSAVIDHRKLL